MVDDVLVTIAGESIDGPGGILAQAGPDAWRSGTYLPYAGSVTLDTADMALMESSGDLLDVLTHEIGHVLGFGTLWQEKGLLAGAGTSNPRFTGPRATAEYNALFNTNSTGVPVEASGGPGTSLSHWRESTFRTELMTGWSDAGASALSRITVASMADFGYQVNLANAEPYSRPATQAATASAGGPLVAGEAFAWHSGSRRYTRLVNLALQSVDSWFAV